MVFSSHIFIFYFLPIVVTLYYVLPKPARHWWLTFCGYIFYGWWNPWFMLLMFGTVFVDYNLGRMIVNAGEDRKRAKLGVVLSVTSNLTLLGFFKYTAFAIESAQGISNWMQWGAIPVPEFFRNIVLPVGISFYVFQSMSYCIDLYRGHAKPADSLLDFMTFVSLFPHLVAGPIVRYGIIAEQMRNRVHTPEGFAMGISRFGFGLSKKLLLADPMGAIADHAFSAGVGSLTTTSAWVGIIAYAFQIYFDFSAYSDIAIGLARMLGFYFVENFNSPYKSLSITDFWRRWHMSLSNFLRDYLYIPLGGNRKGPTRTYVNLMLTMLIGGLWHGAQWTFVIWGAMHGGLLALERMFGLGATSVRKVGKGVTGESTAVPSGMVPVRTAFTFVILLFTWVFFRAENFEVATRYLSAMFGRAPIKPTAALVEAQMLTGFNLMQFIIAWVGVFAFPNTQTILHRFTLWKAALGLVLFVAAVTMMFARGYSPFLYFQF